MRIVILKPTSCPCQSTILYSDCITQEALSLEKYPVIVATSIDDLQSNDLVLYRFGSDLNNWAYANSENCHLEVSKFVQQIESKGCIAYPSSYMLQFYENKKRLHTLFEACNIKTPKTFLVTKDTWKQHIPEFKFPLLLKHLYSCSSNGMKQIESLEELECVLEEELQTKDEVLLQQKIKATREARITYYGESIFHGYYRIRKSENDMSAATSFGSFCDYSIDLQKYKPLIQKLIYDCGMSLGGVDILWENDDETTEPYVLEVSPIFDINPPTPEGWTQPYKDWKAHPVFHSARLYTLQLAAKEYLDFALQEYNKPRLYVDIDHTICNSQPRIEAHPTEYHLQKYVLQDEPFQTALQRLQTYRKTHSIYFLTARHSYENAFLTTRDWLFKHNIQYRGIIFVENLLSKCTFLNNLDSSIEYTWIDDCTVSDESGNRYVPPQVLLSVRNFNLHLQLLESPDDWKTLSI